MRDLILIVALLFLAASLQATKDEYDCRMGWDNIAEYGALADICKYEPARSALLSRKDR